MKKSTKLFLFVLTFAVELLAQVINWNATNITIKTETELREFAALSNNGMHFFGQTLTLANDIELKNGEWTPICEFDDESDYNIGFYGTFDGNNKIISEVYINQPHKSEQGLFGYNQGTIKNLGVVVDIKGKQNVAGLAALNGGAIENCYALGTVVGMEEHATVGGLVGLNWITINSCYAEVNVSGINEVGGLAGLNSSDGTITNSYATGNVTGTGTDIGGLVGWNDNNIKNCYAVGKVIGGGGLVGWNSIGCTIENCYALEDFDNEFIEYDNGTSSGGQRTSEELKQQSAYNNWNFVTTWAIDPTKNNGFPYLRIFDDNMTSIANNFTVKRNNSASFAGIKNGEINLNLKAGNYTAELYNLQGRLITKTDINATTGVNATGIKTDNLSKGMFILNLKQAGISILKHKVRI